MGKFTKFIVTLVISVSLLGTTTIESATANSLTEKQKQQYYKQYVKIVDEAMEKKVGIHIEVVPMDKFKPEDWVEPKAFATMIQNMVDEHITTERETLNALSSTYDLIAKNVNGKTIKTTHIYVSGHIPEIEVTANIETQYNERSDRQLFAKIDNISTHVVGSSGKWEQTSYEASLIDGGRTYSIHIEGIFKKYGQSFEKAFTIEFSCNKFGKIS
ncbi:hypothetical protein [Rummeliibacillus pycnus]|uniref:hypothetical protein n=1 Tax=Rummeliibacillus pycnus TaxID=101070 RepID=UPI0037C8ED52